MTYGRAFLARYWLPVVLFLGAAVAIVQSGSETYRPDQDMSSDSVVYGHMAAGGGYTDDTIKPFRFRVFVPFIAWLLTVARGADAADTDAVVSSFKIINVVAITLLGVGVVALLRRYRFSVATGTVTALGLMLTYPVLRTCGVPLTDSAGHATVAILLALLVWRRWWWAAAFTFVALFTRESGLLAVVIAGLLMLGFSAWWRIAATVTPALVAYLVFRFLVAPTDQGYQLSVLDTVKEMGTTYGSAHGVYLVVLEVVICFGAMWILAAVGVRRNATENRFPQWVLLALPVTFVVPFLIGSHLARVWFTVFPVIALYAALAFEHHLPAGVGGMQEGEPAPDTAHPLPVSR